MDPVAALLSRIEELDREFEDTYLRVVEWAVASDPEDARVVVELSGDFSKFPRERWSVVATEVLEWECHAQWPAGFGSHDPLCHVTEHPLLWTVRDDQGDLYFRGHSSNPAEVASRLEQRHRHETGGWLPMSRFSNSAFRGPLGDLLAGGHGSLASGPTRLLEGYADELERMGFDASLVRRTRPAADAEPGQPLSVVTFGTPSYLGQFGYLIAGDFNCERVE